MAKSFYTDGVGNQQTLTNSQNEKIPIYDTLADAQSDLSNLQEGQIIGTKGPFSQMTLVDTVQNGNMNAVTSNAVANAGFLTSNDVVDQVTVNNMNSVSSNAVATTCQKIIKRKNVNIPNLTIGSDGYTSISSYMPSGMNNFLFAILWTYGTSSGKDAIMVNGDGNYISAQANSTITYVDVAYFYTD